MAEIHAIRAPLLIPRYIHNINNLAQERGLTVSDIYVDRYEEQGGVAEKDRIFATWKGTEAQLRSIGLITRSYHFPLESGWIVMPTACARWGRAVVEGRVNASYFHVSVATVKHVLAKQRLLFGPEKPPHTKPIPEAYVAPLSPLARWLRAPRLVSGR